MPTLRSLRLLRLAPIYIGGLEAASELTADTRQSRVRCAPNLAATDLSSSGAGNGADSAMPDTDNSAPTTIAFDTFAICARAILSLFTKTPAVENEADRRLSQTSRMPGNRWVRCAHAVDCGAGWRGLDVDVDEFGRSHLFRGRGGREADAACAVGGDANRQSLEAPFAQHGGRYPAQRSRRRRAPDGNPEQR